MLVYACVCLCMCVYECVYECMCVCICVRMCVCICMCMNVCICVFECLCVYLSTSGNHYSSLINISNVTEHKFITIINNLQIDY